MHAPCDQLRRALQLYSFPAITRNAEYERPQDVNIQAPALDAAVSDRWLRLGGVCGVAWWLFAGSGMIAGCDRCAAAGAARGSS
jgi:hypothetical protein